MSHPDDPLLRGLAYRLLNDGNDVSPAVYPIMYGSKHAGVEVDRSAVVYIVQEPYLVYFY